MNGIFIGAVKGPAVGCQKAVAKRMRGSNNSSGHTLAPYSMAAAGDGEGRRDSAIEVAVSRRYACHVKQTHFGVAPQHGGPSQKADAFQKGFPHVRDLTWP
ncbi:hypothetical protein SKAU_G00084560 [Synaphobranchus kaupii]|uniref:Uncharacterized protein n=1 Tax=Synaphobranchus kaupii TaxID=118154 RepID=A0A9Q1FWB3_SYNKA|nr:hypothetical protein SKAU_G00084560 [Synaphobranchus kaupii]